ncbi:MAG: hypothetical protein Q9226_006275 [Calogaya cf. arnoldii]
MKFAAATISVLVVATTAAVLSPRAPGNCNDKGKETLTVKNWKQLEVDKSIRAWWNGGKDAEDVEWPGADRYKKIDDTPKRFTTMLGSRLQNKKADSWSCVNLGQADAGSAVFSAAEDLGVLGAIPGLGNVATIANLANPFVSGVSAQLGLHLPAESDDSTFKTAAAFSQAIERYTKQTRDGLVQANRDMLDSADDTMPQILSDGAWVKAPSFNNGTKIEATHIGDFYRRNMVAHGINALWRQWNVYVYYVWLDDAGAKPGDKNTKCDLDRSGPQNSKYCADEGVYYLYLYKKSVGQDGGAGEPYGLGKLTAAPYKINPIWVVESSVRSYKAQGIEYDASKPGLGVLGAVDIDDYLNSPERLEGTWTLPVCDGSSRGRFNVDYMTNKNYSPVGGRGEPPCACGIDGRDTAKFMKAAHLEADDVASKCLVSWAESKMEDWPPGIEKIEYDEEGKHFVMRKEVEECMSVRIDRQSPHPVCSKRS